MVSQQLGVTAGWLYTSWAAGEDDEMAEALQLADGCDPEGVIADAIRGGTHGRVARFITESRPAAA
jgi:hypothetical protein